MTPIAIRLARMQDLEPVRQLATVVWRTHYPGILGPAQIEYMLARGYRREALLPLLDRPGAGLELAEQEGVLVGFAAWYVSADPRTVQLDKLYVHPAHQRAGIGGQLIAHVIALARAAGAATMVLNVNRHNVQAQAAYRKHGFAMRGAALADIGGGFVMDDYIMERSV